MSELKINNRLNWLQEEEVYLKQLHLENGIKSWKEIAALMNSRFSNRNRTPKQYRERFTNYIRFQGQKLERGLWTQEQDAKIFDKYMEMGSKWVEISKAISGRSENNVKNRFYSTMRKLIRRINLALTENKKLHNIRKPLKQASIFKLLQTQNFAGNTKVLQYSTKESKQLFIINLKYDVLRLATQLNKEPEISKLLDMGVLLHRFNTLTRFQSLKKSRKGQITKRKILPPVIRENNENNPINLIKEGHKRDPEDGIQEKKSRQTNESEEVMRNEFLQEGRVEKIEQSHYFDCIQKPRSIEKDLEYELSLILGIKYEPQQFYFL